MFNPRSWHVMGCRDFVFVFVLIRDRKRCHLPFPVLSGEGKLITVDLR